jgi:hypothetical protein
MATPEGKIKAAVNRVLASYPESYRFMPVPSGYGISTLDFLICHYGEFIAVETKAPGKKPTPRQNQIITQIEAAGGVVFVIDRVEQTLGLESYLEKVKLHALAGLSQSEAQARWGTGDAADHQPVPAGKAARLPRRANAARTAQPDRNLYASQAGAGRPGADPDAL